MRENLPGGIHLSPHDLDGSSTTVSSPDQRIAHCGDFQTENKTWGLFVASDLPTLPLIGSDPAQAAMVQERIRLASTVAYQENGQSDAHLDAMHFIMNQWGLISQVVDTRYGVEGNRPKLSPTVEERIYPEVRVRIPMFDSAAGHTLDCVANDRYGNFYVIEIGRGHKSDQLARQLYLARTAYPDVTINGIVAKYRVIDEEKRRMFLRFV